jgi:hypothetical protein
MSVLVKIQKPRSVNTADIFRVNPEPDQEVLCGIERVGERLEAKKHGFTIVLNRDIKASVALACDMGVHLARKFATEQVLLVNTYAGTNLMQRSLACALHAYGVLLPVGYKQYFDERYLREEGREGFVEGVPDPNPENLQVLDCPTGSCDPWRIEEEVALRGSSIIVINSFEFAAMSSWGRQLLAQGLLELHSKTRCSVVIFSQELRSDIIPFRKGRGALGMLSAHASSVWKMMTPYEEEQYRKRFRRHDPNEKGWLRNVEQPLP